MFDLRVEPDAQLGPTIRNSVAHIVDDRVARVSGGGIPSDRAALELAHMFAAAPDMLKALQKVAMCPEAMVALCRMETEAAEFLRATIARAEGESA